MNTQTIEPAAAPAGVPLLSDALMHALAASEQAVSYLTTMPQTITVDEYHGVYCVSLFFPQSPDAIVAFATALQLPEVVTAPNPGTDGTTFTEATAYVAGIPVRAWTLTTDEPEDQAPDVLTPTAGDEFLQQVTEARNDMVDALQDGAHDAAGGEGA